MATWLTSDTHFNHRNIISYCDRPFFDVLHMNRSLIDSWNNVVAPQDTVYHLGDIGFSTPQNLEEIFFALNGRKIFIKGNHDTGSILEKLSADGCYHEHMILSFMDSNGKMRNIYMVHNPMTYFVNCRYNHSKNDLLLYGHVHEHAASGLHYVKNGERKILAYHVGVDTNDYRPVNLNKIVDMYNRSLYNKNDFEIKDCNDKG